LYEVSGSELTVHYTTLHSPGRISRVPSILQMACPDFTGQAICLSH